MCKKLKEVINCLGKTRGKVKETQKSSEVTAVLCSGSGETTVNITVNPPGRENDFSVEIGGEIIPVEHFCDLEIFFEKAGFL